MNKKSALQLADQEVALQEVLHFLAQGLAYLLLILVICSFGFVTGLEVSFQNKTNFNIGNFHFLLTLPLEDQQIINWLTKNYCFLLHPSKFLSRSIYPILSWWESWPVRKNGEPYTKVFYRQPIYWQTWSDLSLVALLLIRLEGDQYLLFLRYLPLSQVGLKSHKVIFFVT